MKSVNDYTKNILKQIKLDSPLYENYKKGILEKFIHHNKHLAIQGSAEWLANRTYNIGGSEMSIITGENPYSAIDNLVANKLGFSTFSGNIATRWGKLFEYVTQIISTIVLEIDEIKETGSLDGAVPNQKYSPDGLAVIKVHCADIINNEKINTLEYCIILFEFKSPLNSIPDGIIPSYYLPQVKTGLCSIPITDFAIFINNMFRKCAFEDLNASSKYDISFHSSDKKKNLPEELPLAFGIILFYQTNAQRKSFYEKYKTDIGIESSKFDEFDESNNSDESDESDESNMRYIFNSNLYNFIYTSAKHNIRDFGKSYYKEFNEILQMFDDKLISVDYCKPHILEKYNNNTFLSAQQKNKGSNNFQTTIDEYKDIIGKGTVNGRNIFGFLPWKLIKSDIIYQERDYNYVHKYNDKIQTTINIIKKINALPSHDDKVALFMKYYPKNKLFKNYDDIKDFIPR